MFKLYCFFFQGFFTTPFHVIICMFYEGTQFNFLYFVYIFYFSHKQKYEKYAYKYQKGINCAFKCIDMMIGFEEFTDSLMILTFS